MSTFPSSFKINGWKVFSTVPGNQLGLNKWWLSSRYTNSIITPFSSYLNNLPSNLWLVKTSSLGFQLISFYISPPSTLH